MFFNYLVEFGGLYIHDIFGPKFMGQEKTRPAIKKN